MRAPILWRVLSIVTIVFALSSQGLAQSAGGGQIALSGLINHYTADLDGAGAWHINGDWSLRVAGKGKAIVGFAATLNMVRADNAPRQPHTHHVMLTNGTVTQLANGFRISGAAVVTGNGAAAMFSPAQITVDITGGATVQFSNLALTFQGSAAEHFGAGPLTGAASITN